MSAEEKKEDMVENIARWESELWSYVSSGDGMCCPLYSRCRARQRGGWCADDNKYIIHRCLDAAQFNPNAYEHVGSFPRGRIFEIVEKLTHEWVKSTGVRFPPMPTEIVSLFSEHHTVEVRLLPLTIYHGAIWRLPDRWIIYLKDSDAAVTRRFTLFHEGFHILAHGKTTPVFKKRGVTRGSFNELLADYFAICILMPREWVKEKWAEVKRLNQMAKIFGVPESAMWLRLREMDLI